MKISSETQRSIIPAEDKLKFFVIRNYKYEKLIIIFKKSHKKLFKYFFKLQFMTQ